MRICHTYEYVTDVLHMRALVRIRNNYIYVRVWHVEYNPCANNMKSSHLIKLQRKVDTVGMCKPNVTTNQNLHFCHAFFPYHSGWCKAWSDVIIAIERLLWVYTVLMLLMLFFSWHGSFTSICTCTLIAPSGHTTLKWRRINVDATWSRHIDVDTTSFSCCVPAGADFHC